MFVHIQSMKHFLIILLTISLSFSHAFGQYKAELVRTHGTTKWGKIYLKKGNRIHYRIKHERHLKKGRIKEITENSFILRGGVEVPIKELQMIKFMFPLEKALGYGFGAPIFALGVSNIIYPIVDANSSQPSQALTSTLLVAIGTALIATSFLLILQKHQFDIPTRWKLVISKKKKDKS